MKRTLLAGLVGLLPIMAFAQQVGTLQNRTVGGVLEWFKTLLNTMVPILIALAVVWFLWNVFMFIVKEGEDKDKAKTGMIWGIVAIAVMVSVWGLVGILTNTFGTSTNVGNIPNLIP